MSDSKYLALSTVISIRLQVLYRRNRMHSNELYVYKRISKRYIVREIYIYMYKERWCSCINICIHCVRDFSIKIFMCSSDLKFLMRKRCNIPTRSCFTKLFNYKTLRSNVVMRNYSLIPPKLTGKIDDRSSYKLILPMMKLELRLYQLVACMVSLILFNRNWTPLSPC